MRFHLKFVLWGRKEAFSGRKLYIITGKCTFCKKKRTLHMRITGK